MCFNQENETHAGELLQMQSIRNGEKRHTFNIVEHLLQPLVGDLSRITLNEMEYGQWVPQGCKVAKLRVGNPNSWHGAPNGRCGDMNFIALNTHSSAPSSASRTPPSSPGDESLLEAKAVPLQVRSLYKIVGNVVTYSFVHNVRHKKQNPLVPIIGLSKFTASMMLLETF